MPRKSSGPVRVPTGTPNVYRRVLAHGLGDYEVKIGPNKFVILRDTAKLARGPKHVPQYVKDQLAALRTDDSRDELPADTTTKLGPFATEWAALRLANAIGEAERTGEEHEARVRRYIVPELGNMRVSEITFEHIEGFIGRLHRKRKLSPNTIRNTVGTLGQILHRAQRKRLTTRNAVKEIAPGTLPKVKRQEMTILSDEEIDGLVALAPLTRGRTYSRTGTLVLVLAYSGLRISEALALQWKHVPRDGRPRLVIREQMARHRRERTDTKTPKAVREVFIDDRLAKALAAYRLAVQFSGEEDYLFTAGADGRSLTYCSASKDICDLAKASGIDFHAHELRHTFASGLIAFQNPPLPITYIAAQLGHADPTVTLRVYGHLFNVDRLAEIAVAQMNERTQGARGAI